MLCVKFVPKKAPMLCVKFSPKKAPHVKCFFCFFNRRILLHGKNSQKRDKGGFGLALEIQTMKAELLIY